MLHGIRIQGTKLHGVKLPSISGINRDLFLPIIMGLPYVDREHDKVDGPPDEGLSTTIARKVGRGQKG
jgi:hypothetical protein